MALALLGGAARAVGGQMAKSGGKAMAKKVMNRGDKKQNKSVSGRSAQQSGGKSGALTVRPKTTLIPASTIKSSGSKTPDVAGVSGGNILESIYNSVVQIDKILKGTLAEEKALTKEKTKQDQKEERDKKEGKLEKKKTKEEKKEKGLSIPKLSFFDRIKQFITSIITGFILQKLVDFGPEKLEGIIKAISGGIDFVADSIVAIVDAAGTFLLWGQKVIDGSKDWLRKNRGDEAVERLNKLLGSLGNLFNATIIVGALAAKLGGGKKRKPGQKPRGRPGPRVKPTRSLINKPGSALGPRGNARKIQLKHGHAARGIYQNSYDNAVSKGRTPKQAAETANAAVKKAIKKGRIISKPQTGSLGGTDKGSSLMKGGFKKAPGRLGLKLFGKQGVKLVSKTFGKIPVMGPLIVAVASLLAGEPIGQAVFKGLGAALGGLLGSFIPIPVIGTILGETIGVLVGDMMYSLILGGGPAEAGEKFGAALKTALDVGGLVLNFFKEGFGRFFKDFPTVDIPEGGGVQTALGKIAGLIGLGENKKFMKDGRLVKMPNLSILFNPVAMLTELIPHAAASFLPAIFGAGGTAFGGSKKAPDNKPEKSTGSSGSSGGGASGESGGGKKLGNLNVEKSNNIVNIGKDLISKGFSVAEHPDFTKTPTSSGGAYTPGKGSVSNVHSGAGHYEGRAIDVTDWRGSLEDSKGRYRNILDSVYDDGNMGNKLLIHDSWGIADQTGKDGPGAHGHPTHMHIEVKDKGGKIGKGLFANMGGPEFVLDNDSYSAIKMKYPGFLAALNAADGAGTLKVLEAYASYEQGGESTVVINQNQLPASATQQKQSSSAPIVIPMDSSNPTESLYAMS